ncbi:MAG: hypothetical protein JXA38_07585 [Methanosarcinaceae archaeon]|nr:hypothetical protein [Methanosarcinaceae archaeon]
MKYLIAFVLISILFSGCAEIAGNTPGKTVERFASAFEDGDFDKCYTMMSTEYRVDTDLGMFVNICKKVNPSKYEFLEVTAEYIDQDDAVVDISVNESSVDIDFSFEKFIELTPEIVTKTLQIELVKENEKWKFKTFPYALT